MVGCRYTIVNILHKGDNKDIIIIVVGGDVLTQCATLQHMNKSNTAEHL
jgi:hypothetical protein